MRNGLTIPLLLAAAAGCGGLAHFDAQFDDVPFHSETVRHAEGVEVALLLLAAKEGKDIGEMEAPAPKGEKEDRAEPSGKAGGFVLRIGGGLALPGTGAIGSAGESAPKVPAYSDVWTSGGAFEVVGEFGAGKKIMPYAQVSLSQFAGQKWTNPSDPTGADTWLASDSSLTLVAGGVRFGGRFYGKAAVGLWLWPEVSRVDYFNGYAEPIFASGAAGVLTVGGGAEFKLGGLKAYVDAEFVLGGAPAKAENAVVFWPEFEAAGMNSFKIAGGVGLSF